MQPNLDSFSLADELARSEDFQKWTRSPDMHDLEKVAELTIAIGYYLADHSRPAGRDHGRAGLHLFPPCETGDA